MVLPLLLPTELPKSLAQEHPGCEPPQLTFALPPLCLFPFCCPRLPGGPSGVPKSLLSSLGCIQGNGSQPVAPDPQWVAYQIFTLQFITVAK